jgi:predicted Zn-dependent peptidase
VQRFAAIFVAALCASAVQVQAASAVQAGALLHGGTYIAQADPTVANAAIGVWFRAPSAGYDNASTGIAQFAAVACAAAKLQGGRSLVELVRSVGGNLNIDVYPDIVGVSVTVPAGAARRVIATMTAAYFAPRIDAASFKIARQDAAVQYVQHEYDPDRSLHDALFAQLFSAGPAHYTTIPPASRNFPLPSLNATTAFAQRAFRSSNAVLSLAGNVNLADLSAITDGAGPAASDAPYDSQLTVSPKDGDVGGAIDGVGLAWTGPPISDEKAATALDFINDYLFREETGITQQELTAPNVGLAGQFITLHNPGVMVVTIAGNAADASSARLLVLRDIAKLGQPLSAAEFERARQAFVYHILSDTQTPQAQADNFGWYSVEGNAGYAPGDPEGTYLQNAAALDPRYVAGVVRRYLGTPVTVRMHGAAKTGSGGSAQ